MSQQQQQQHNPSPSSRLVRSMDNNNGMGPPPAQVPPHGHPPPPIHHGHAPPVYHGHQPPPGHYGHAPPPGHHIMGHSDHHPPVHHTQQHPSQQQQPTQQQQQQQHPMGPPPPPPSQFPPPPGHNDHQPGGMRYPPPPPLHHPGHPHDNNHNINNNNDNSNSNSNWMMPPPGHHYNHRPPPSQHQQQAMSAPAQQQQQPPSSGPGPSQQQQQHSQSMEGCGPVQPPPHPGHTPVSHGPPQHVMGGGSGPPPHHQQHHPHPGHPHNNYSNSMMPPHEHNQYNQHRPPPQHQQPMSAPLPPPPPTSSGPASQSQQQHSQSMGGFGPPHRPPPSQMHPGQQQQPGHGPPHGQPLPPPHQGMVPPGHPGHPGVMSHGPAPNHGIGGGQQPPPLHHPGHPQHPSQGVNNVGPMGGGHPPGQPLPPPQHQQQPLPPQHQQPFPGPPPPGHGHHPYMHHRGPPGPPPQQSSPYGPPPHQHPHSRQMPHHPQGGHPHHVQMGPPQPPQGPPPSGSSAPQAMYGYQQQMMRREINFPPGTIEATTPILMKRRRLTPRDLGPNIDTTRLMMCLKGGLLAESTWALDCLSILFHDESAFLSSGLQNIPGLLDTLIEHYKVYLKEIFVGLFDDELDFKRDLIDDTFKSNKRKSNKMSKRSKNKTHDADGKDGKGDNDEKVMSCDDGDDNYELGNGLSAILRYKSRCKLKASRGNDWYNLDGIEGCKDDDDTTTTDGLSYSKRRSIKKKNCTNNCKNDDKDDEDCDMKKKLNQEICLDPKANNKFNNHDETTATIKKMNGLNGYHDEDDDLMKLKGNKLNKKYQKDDLDRIVLLSNSLNFTLKSRDGKPVKVVEDKSGLLIEDIENQWKSLVPNHRKKSKNLFDGDDDGSDSNMFNEDDDSNEDDEDEYNWNDTQHILKSFVPKQRPLRFARVLKSCDKYQWSTSDKDEKVNEVPSKKTIKKTTTTAIKKDDSKKGDNKDVKNEDEFVPTFRCPRKRSHDVPTDKEEESFYRDDPPLVAVDEYCDNLSRRCLCLSTLIRNLSFVSNKDLEMVRNKELMYILGRLLLLNHDHPNKKIGAHLSNQRRMEEQECVNSMAEEKTKDVKEPEAAKDDDESLFNEDDDNEKKEPKEVPFVVPSNTDKLVGEEEDLETGSNEWYWNMLHLLLENSLVTLANISGCLDVSPLPEYISLPLIDGLLHWSVCQSSYAQDHLPTTSVLTLSPQRMALETLVKMSILDSNVDLILATPPWERLDSLFKYLTKLLSRNEDQTLREFSLVLLVNLSSADSSIARAVALTGTAIPQLISFLEQAEMSAMAVANQSGLKALRENPEMMGTSLDMVRRSANCLRNLSQIAENRPLFMAYQSRLLSLVMSQILDQGVASIMADIIYECSLSDPVIEQMEFLPSWNPPSPVATRVQTPVDTTTSSVNGGPPQQLVNGEPSSDVHVPTSDVIDTTKTSSVNGHYPLVNHENGDENVNGTRVDTSATIKSELNGPIVTNGQPVVSSVAPTVPTSLMNGNVCHVNGIMKGDDEDDSNSNSSHEVPIHRMANATHLMVPTATDAYSANSYPIVSKMVVPSGPTTTLELVSPVSMSNNVNASGGNPLERMQEMNNRGADSKACPRLKELLLSFTPSPPASNNSNSSSRPPSSFDGQSNNAAEQVS